MMNIMNEMQWVEVTVNDIKPNWGEPKMENKGVVPGYLRMFNFEVENIETGDVDYMGATGFYGTPKQFIEEWAYGDDDTHYFDTVLYKGFKPTGRVVFRGYYTEKYDPYERDSYVVEVESI